VLRPAAPRRSIEIHRNAAVDILLSRS
jgi:hypothetical protein